MTHEPGAAGAVRRALHLRTFPAFVGLAPEALAVLAQPCLPRELAPGEALYVPGTPVDALHFILEGEVEVFEGGVRVRTMRAREAVGGLAVLDPGPEGLDARARVRTRTLALRRGDLEAVFEDHPEVRVAVTRALARTLLHLLQPRSDVGGPGAEGGSVDPRLAGDVVERILWFCDAFAFSGITVAAAADLARDAIAVELGAGRIWASGDRAGRILMPIEGRLEQAGEGGVRRSVPLGGLVGLVEALADEPRWYDLEALGSARALALDADLVFDVADEHRELALGLLRALARAVTREYRAREQA